jgi:type II secretory pathway pseudopilin PulG
MRRRAFTMAEALVALGIGLLVIGAMLMVFLSIGKMTRSSELSGALQEAALAMAIIQKDLMQAVQKPDPNSKSPVQTLPTSFQMIRGTLKDDGSITGERIVYRKEPTASGAYRLRRQIGEESTLIPGTFKDLIFGEYKGDGGPYVRVSIRLEVHEGGKQECLLSSLVRVSGPEFIRSPVFDFKFMFPLIKINFLGL